MNIFLQLLESRPCQIVFPTFLGAFLGFLFAIWVDRLKTSKERNVQRKQMMEVLKKTIADNLALIETLEKDLKPQDPYHLPLQVLDLTILESTASQKYELLDDPPFCAIIDRARYEAIRLNELLRMLREMRPFARDIDLKDSFFTMTVRKFSSLVPETKNALQSAIHAFS